MRFLARRGGVPAEVRTRAALPPGEPVLAWAEARDGTWLLGTRRRLVLVPPGEADVPTIPWEEVEDAAWDTEASRLRISEVGQFGQVRPAYSFEMEEPPRLLQLVRERVTSSILLQRRVRVRGRQAITVIGRRSPEGGEVRWMHAYDPGLDPDDPEVRRAADAALAAAMAEVGQSP
ncbi:MAG TPA: hypothetical protein VFJ28_03870 [Marmoricola sp.]|nr:hypothetical protein [Marmoricola sp.]